MKHIYLIGGTMGVGKTTTSQILKKKLSNAVFLDGDWCWDADPFQVTDETKAMALDNICHLLNNFIHCSAYENIIFCWVMHEQSIIDNIVSRLDLSNFKVISVSLICDKTTLKHRLQKDIDAGIRDREITTKSLQRIPLYQHLNTIKIDVSQLLPEEAANQIMRL